MNASTMVLAGLWLVPAVSAASMALSVLGGAAGLPVLAPRCSTKA